MSSLCENDSFQEHLCTKEPQELYDENYELHCERVLLIPKLLFVLKKLIIRYNLRVIIKFTSQRIICVNYVDIEINSCIKICHSFHKN